MHRPRFNLLPFNIRHNVLYAPLMSLDYNAGSTSPCSRYYYALYFGWWPNLFVYPTWAIIQWVRGLTDVTAGFTLAWFSSDSTVCWETGPSSKRQSKQSSHAGFLFCLPLDCIELACSKAHYTKNDGDRAESRRCGWEEKESYLGLRIRSACMGG